ncbi:MAG: nucleotidyltransferase family protein [Planctomycetota bacterium]
MASILHEPGGFLRHAAPERTITILVNKVDILPRKDTRTLVDALGHGRVNNIVWGAALDEAIPFENISNRDHRVASIVLAAGASSRHGTLKQVQEVLGMPLIRHAVQTAKADGISKVYVVVGHGESRVRAALDSEEGLEFVLNPMYREGLSSSIRAGLGAARGYDAALLVLGDMPLMGRKLASSVVRTYRASTAPLGFPEVEGVPGHPVIFRTDLWPALCKIRGDRGGREVLETQRTRGARIQWEDGRTQLDLDFEVDHECFESSR